ncbi:MAG: 2-oxoacid:acceptor oxidoreductase family protein, partial [Planctomycetota bacterium]|nr:2-oxoacid:acceptor oxidoreductase family protein [Planctomycetota bacterium]
MKLKQRSEAPTDVRFPGTKTAMDGSEAVVAMETNASDGAGAYPITPSTQMGEGWAAAVAAGKRNVFGRKLVFFEPEGEHAAAAVTAGMNLVGLRATNFSSGQGIAYMHESLYAAVGKRLCYVLNVACRAMTKQALNVHAGHDDYHAIDDTGFFQLFAKDVQGAADLNLISHRISELSLNPGINAQDGFLTSHVIEALQLPEPELIREYLGDPAEMIESPTPAQRLVFGEKRRRVPELFDFDYPAMLGVVQNQDAYAQGVAAQRPFYFDHIQELTDQAMDEYAALTGRQYRRVMGYRLEDAEYVIVGQGSVVANAEAVCDYLRDVRHVKVGVLNVTMFRPFPSDLIAEALKGRKGVVVLERVDQPLAADAPLLREIRTALGKAFENSVPAETLAYPDIPIVHANEMPAFYSGCFGMGSRDLQPGDLVAAVVNMLPGGAGRRQFYLGLEFIRPETRLPKLQIWQDRLLEGYPKLGELALPTAGDFDLLPEGSTSLRIHSVGGWGAITMGKNLALATSELLGLHVKANPKYGSEKKGRPTSFYATFAPDPIRLNCELKHVDVVLSPDPNVFLHSNPLAGLSDGGAFVIQSEWDAPTLWNSLPQTAQRTIREKKIRVFFLDAFKIAQEEASEEGLRYRMQGAAFLGSFFRASTLTQSHGVDEGTLFERLEAQVRKKFTRFGEAVVQSNLRVQRRGYDEVQELDYESFELGAEMPAPAPQIPSAMQAEHQRQGIAHQGRFFEQVCHLYMSGEDGIADPFAAISAIPAATTTITDLTSMRYEVPEFKPALCTGCSQCWTQCPDSAIPGVVNSVDEVLDAGLATIRTRNGNGDTFERITQIKPHLARETRRLLKAGPFENFGEVLDRAYAGVIQKLGPDPERRAELDHEYAPLVSALAEFPLARTVPFFEVPESDEKGTGGLLSITVNPKTCKGCNICVDVCPAGALVTIKQDDEAVDKLRRNWDLWERLPDTDDRYVNIARLEDGIGVLPSMLLKKSNYYSMLGGDGACMGCGEKTAVHLVLSAVNALLMPRVAKHVEDLEGLIEALDHRAREVLASDADIDHLEAGDGGHVDIVLDPDKQAEVKRLSELKAALKDLRWRYTEGPSGHGRATVGFANSTGCSSVWGSTYPYNPYPFPWVNHLFQDAPSIAIGLFEAHMRKMAEGFVAVRRARLVLDGSYDPAVHEPQFEKFDWHQFDDEEFGLCPPVFAVGGDGAMLDIGFQNLSRLMASGKPVRVLVLDTQVYSNTGGQACTSSYLGQVSDMAVFGQAQHGKTETRKELALIAMAHRGVYVLESSQGSATHLLGGVLRGLQTRRPSVFLLHTPCPPEHGLSDHSAHRAARLAVESRAFPLLVYDPDEGETVADCLDLDGNPALDETWPTYTLEYLDEDGAEQSMELPLTIADWAADEGRFKKHFREINGAGGGDMELVPFHEYLALEEEEREDVEPFIHALRPDNTLRRLKVSSEIVTLAEERVGFWNMLREMAEDEEEGLSAEAEEALRAQHEQELEDLKRQYPALVAKQLATGLLEASNGGAMTVGELLAKATGVAPTPT